jgi:hypothetical protein
MAYLKANPEEKIIVRCPTCPQHTRWAAIYHNGENGLVWETIKRPDSTSFEEELVFDTVLNTQQVG